jgi:hypothetical protein
MSDQDSSSMCKRTVQDTVVEQMVSDIRINCTERVIEQHHLAVVIGRPCDTDPLSLTTGQGDSSFTD